MIKKISEVIPEKNILILSPHYDDAPLIFGGYLDALAVNQLISDKNLRIINIFSRSNYQARDEEGNMDVSLKRTQYATGIRLIEDLNCLDELLGHGNYTYEIKAERECMFRQKGWKPGEAFEFPQGNKDNFNEADWEIYAQIKKYASQWIITDDKAILLPLGVKEHVDHVILRDAVVDARSELANDGNATIYFGEDQPYTGLADNEDWEKAETFLNRLSIEQIDYGINEERKANLVLEYYPTQVEESYREGILNRSAQLKHKYGTNTGVERIYRIK
jgi:hypothetical protein